MSIHLSIEQVLQLRLRAQRLFVPPGSGKITAVALARAVAGFQAQDLPAATLAFRSRSHGLTAIDVAREIQSGALVRTWLFRGTLHLLAAEDARWLIPFLGPLLLPGHARRLAQLGWDADRLAEGLRLLDDALARRGPLTRPEVIQLLTEHHLPDQGQAPIHLIYQAALKGRLCYGPDRGKLPTFIRFEDWVGRMQPKPDREALADLALRYLQAYGPASPADFSAWSGLKMGAAREAWKRNSEIGVTVEVDVGSRQALALLKEQQSWLDDWRPAPASIRLLPRFDTFLLGYASRDWILDLADAERIKFGGIIAQTLLTSDGRLIGTWRAEKARAGLSVHIQPFTSLDPALQPALESEIADVIRFYRREQDKQDDLDERDLR